MHAFEISPFKKARFYWSKSHRDGTAARFFCFRSFIRVFRADATPPTHRGCLKDSLKHCAMPNHGRTPHLKCCATLPTIPHWRRYATLPRADLPHGQQRAMPTCGKVEARCLVWWHDCHERSTGNPAQRFLSRTRPTGTAVQHSSPQTTYNQTGSPCRVEGANSRTRHVKS